MVTTAGTEPVTPPATPPVTVASLLRRVLLVHPDPLQRRTITAQLRELGVLAVLEASSLTEARLAASSPGPHDLAVVGVDPAEPDCSALLAELEVHGWSRVVVLMPHAGARQIVTALLGGATGVLAGPVAPAPASPGLRLVGSDEPDASPVRSSRVPGVRFVPDMGGTPKALSHREQEILQLAADGQPNREIAERLGLSPLTVKSHLGRIGRKLGSGDRAQLVLLALRAGAIT